MTEEREFKELLSRCLDGTATPEEVRKVLDAVKDAEHLQKDLHDEAAFEASLKSLGHDSEEFARKVMSAIGHKGSSRRFAKLMRNRLERDNRRRWNAPAWFLGIAAVALLALAVFLFAPSGKVPEPPPRTPPRIAEQPAVQPPSPVPKAPPPAPKVASPQAPEPAPKEIEPEKKLAVEPDRKTPDAPRPAPEKPSPPEKAPAPVPPGPIPETRPAVAALELVVGIVKVGGAPARAGRSLLSGEGLETGDRDSRARVKFPDGTVLEIGLGTELGGIVEDQGKCVKIVRGIVRAEVARQPPRRPMVFETPQAVATVLGTTLRLTVDPDPKKGTRLDVEEGKVRLLQTLTKKSVEVLSGYYAVAAAGVEMVARPLPVDDIVLDASQGRIARPEWRLIEDIDAFGKRALEAGKAHARTTPGVVFTFKADADKSYFIWVRGRRGKEVAGGSDNVVIESPGATFTLGSGKTEARAGFDGYSNRAGYWWISSGDNDHGYEEYTPHSVRFTRPGTQTLYLSALEAPMKVDLIWLSTSQVKRPKDDQLGPGRSNLDPPPK